MNKCKFYGGLIDSDIIKVERYIDKKGKKWFNIEAKVQTTVNGDKLLKMYYTIEDGEPSFKNWLHCHRILINKLK